MSAAANVRSIQAIDEFKAALARFCDEAQVSVTAAEREIHRIVDWLTEREGYWHAEVRRRHRLLAQAKATLTRCKSAGHHDPETGRHYEPPCTTEQEAMLRAQVLLRDAEAEQQNVQQWKWLIQQRISEYECHARQLRKLLDDDLPKAKAFLGRKVAVLQSYATMSAVSIGRFPLDSGMSMPDLPSADSEQIAFRNRMIGLTRVERGAWGEQTVANEARHCGYRILMEHDGQATKPGYDTVSWDGKQLHIWEVKNYSAGENDEAGRVWELSALNSNRLPSNVGQFLQNLPFDDEERAAIIQAIHDNAVQWHIRFGPDTDIAFKPLNELGWEWVDVRQYSYSEMLESVPLEGSVAMDPTSQMQPEFREGNRGGPEYSG